MTLKAADDFSAPWLVLYADTVDEAKALLAEAGNKGLGVDLGNAARGLQSTYVVAGSMGQVEQVATEVQPTYAAPAQAAPPQYTAPAAPAAPQAAPQVAPPAAPAAPPANALFCPHGQRTYKTGTGRTGNWAAHFCPLPKGHPDQCEAIWA